MGKKSTKGHLPEKYWLYKRGRYILMGDTLPPLPEYEKKYESLFRRKGVYFKKDGSKTLKVLDPKVDEEEELTLMAFKETYKGYEFFGMYTEMLPTKKTVKGAFRYNEEVVRPIVLEKKLLTILGGRKVAYSKERIEADVNGIVAIPVLLLRDGDYSNSEFSVIFNKNRISQGSSLTINVPKGTEGIFIGTKGWQTKEWCELLGVKYIKIIGV